MPIPDRLPIIILAGSDSRPGDAPAGVPRDAVLAGPKGTLTLRSGRCLAAELIDRVRASQRFGEPLLLGSRSEYAGKVDCEIRHVEGSLLQTLRELAKIVQERFAGEQPFAVTSCDILPSAADFRQLLDRNYAPHAAAMFWWQMIESQPEAMGAGAWKPYYRLPPDVGQEPRSLYPGHVVIARAGALRFPLMNRLLQLAYRYRNRVLEKRYVGITWGGLGTLLAQDLRNLGKLQCPMLTLQIPYVGLRAYFRYRRGQATMRDVENFLAKAFVHRGYQRAAGGRPVVIAISPLAAFAKDIDTRAELDELDVAER
ncbi:MAG: hypothetical protein ACYC3X_12040 [Pirellulaceae bacterium]